MDTKSAGRIGGNRTKEKSPPDYYSKLGKKGGNATKTKYGPKHYEDMGAKGGNAVLQKYGLDFLREIGRKGGRKRKTQQSSESQIPKNSSDGLGLEGNK